MTESNHVFDNQLWEQPIQVTPERMLAGWSQGEIDRFVGSCDRLVRHLLEVGCACIYCVRGRITPDQRVYLDSADLSVVIDDLDLLLRDTSTAMLALARVLDTDATEQTRR